MADAFSEEALPRRAFELAWVDCKHDKTLN